MSQIRDLRVDRSRLLRTIEETGAFGATAKGGVSRLALSDQDRQVRDWLARQCREAGCALGVDALGTMFAQRRGRNPNRFPVACGSHLDTQPAGGRFDGILGVLSGLEVIRSLNDAGVETDAPICVINWTNEEGARFAPAAFASGVYAGQNKLEWVMARRDSDGITFAEALSAIGYDGLEPVGERRFEAYLELHIEQGAVLERHATDIGVVEGGQGMIWYDATITGKTGHAGTMQMDLRRDAITAFSDLCLEVETLAKSCRDAVGTIGLVQTEPGSRNSVAGRTRFPIEFRNPESAALDALDRALRAAARTIAARRDVEVSIEAIWRAEPRKFDAKCISVVEEAARGLGYSRRPMWSGATHDACHVSLVTPTAMIFVPCRDGVSHSEDEYASPEACEHGANVLLRSICTLAG